MFFLLSIGFVCTSALATAETIISYDVVGLNGEPLKNVETALDSATKIVQQRNPILEKNDVTRLMRNNEQVIKSAIQPYGYFFPRINSTIQQMDHNQWQIIYDVKRGPGVHLSNVRIKIIGQGDEEPEFLKWKRKFPLKVGDLFNSNKYTDGKQSFFNVANRIGYIKSKNLLHKVIIDLNSYTAVIDLVYDTEQKYYYGPITLGKSRLQKHFIRRYIPIKTGERFSIPRLLATQQNLSNSGYFSDMTIKQGKVDPRNNQIPLHMKFAPIKNMQYLLGVGYGTDTGARAQAGWNWRRVNSLGHHMETNYNVSQIGNNFVTTYYIPGLDPINEQYAISANIASFSTDAGDSSIQRYSVVNSLKQNLWQISYGISFQTEKFTLSGQPTEYARLFMPNVTWTYLRTNDPLKPKYGERISLNIQGSNAKLASDLSFIQYQFQIRSLIPIDHRNRFYLRGNIGSTFTDKFSLLPLSLRFTAGGAQSVRGYAYQSLGPAENLLTASAEYQYRFIGEWYAAYFQDIGNAFNSFSDMNLQRSQGIGLIWQSPIGSMEIDYAKSLTERSNKATLQFSMGGLL